jgi:hypothetical protein
VTPLEALQRTLAGEHAAVWVYAALGGRVSVSAHPDLAGKVRAAYNTHRGRRDQLFSMIRAADATPVASKVSYELPTPARTPDQVTQAALEVERGCTAVYADMVESTSRANRQWAIDALVDSAVRQLGFGGSPDVFPGLAEL